MESILWLECPGYVYPVLLGQKSRLAGYQSFEDLGIISSGLV